MASWAQIEDEAPRLAGLAREFLDVHKHKTIATLRADGSPRISGIEVEIEDDELRFGSMPGSRKGSDLSRDPRFTLHSGSEDPPEWGGDAKLAGRAVEAPSPGSDAQHFHADIRELSVVRLNDARDGPVIELWKEGEGVRTMSRK